MAQEHYITATATNKDQPEIEIIATDIVKMNRGDLVHVIYFLRESLNPTVHYDAFSPAKMSQEAFAKIHEKIKSALALLEKVK